MRHTALLGLLFLLGACGSKDTKQKQLPASKGLVSELLVVCDPELLQSDLHDSILLITEGQMPGLGTDEMIFRTNNLTPRALTPAFEMMHSQVIFHVDARLPRPRLAVAYNVKAQPQIQIHVTAPDHKSMRRWLSEQREAIQWLLLDFQAERMAASLRRQGEFSPKVYQELQSTAGYSIQVPAVLTATKREKDFLWGSTNRNVEDMNFLYYSFPWDGQPLSIDVFADKRDSVLQKNIPGSTGQQWMATARGLENRPAIIERNLRMKGETVKEMRGLWALHGGFMGGPFVALAHTDTLARRILVFEGFVYNPNAQKRDLMRQLEGALRTARRKK